MASKQSAESPPCQVTALGCSECSPLEEKKIATRDDNDPATAVPVPMPVVPVQHAPIPVPAAAPLVAPNAPLVAPNAPLVAPNAPLGMAEQVEIVVAAIGDMILANNILTTNHMAVTKLAHDCKLDFGPQLGGLEAIALYMCQTVPGILDLAVRSRLALGRAPGAPFAPEAPNRINAIDMAHMTATVGTSLCQLHFALTHLLADYKTLEQVGADIKINVDVQLTGLRNIVQVLNGSIPAVLQHVRVLRADLSQPRRAGQ